MNLQEIYDELDRILYQCEEFDCMKKRLEELKSEIGYELYQQRKYELKRDIKQLPIQNDSNELKKLVREYEESVIDLLSFFMGGKK